MGKKSCSNCPEPDQSTTSVSNEVSLQMSKCFLSGYHCISFGAKNKTRLTFPHLIRKGGELKSVSISDSASLTPDSADPTTRMMEVRKPDIFSLSKRVAYSDHSSNPLCGFSMMEQVRLCTVCLMDNWLGTSKTTEYATFVL